MYLLQSGDGSAFQQAESWVQSASAWAARLLAAFPLYRDLLQPVALAVHEMRTGLATLVAARKGLQSAIQDVQLGAVVAQIGAFPQRAQGALHATTVLFIQQGMPSRPDPHTKETETSVVRDLSRSRNERAARCVQEVHGCAAPRPWLQ